MNSKDLEARIEDQLGSAPPRSDAFRLDPPPHVADHQLIRRIGAGSYGEVWLAHNVIGQWRAVKVVARARFESDRPYEREFRGVVQFEPISRSHSGLIQVLHVGRDDAAGAFYYVMELADAVAAPDATPDPPTARAPTQEIHSPSAPSPDGFAASYQPRTLRSDLDSRGRLPVAEVVALGVELSGALGHIHRHGLVHRDVKPSNVIFAQGQPKLADLGLVATTQEARSFVGTEGFIPPEGPGSVKADLFALGRLLYEAATGRDRCSFPEVPADLDTWPDRDRFLELNEVLARLCAPEPHNRCANAAEAAGDLNLVLAGRSVRRAYGVERRLRIAIRLCAVAVGVLALAGGIVWLQELRQQRAEDRAASERTLRERAQAAELESRQQLYTALLEQARATVRSGELGQRVRALEAIQRAARIRNTPELRREAIAALALPDLRFDRELPIGSKFTVRQLDPAFGRIAVGQGRGPIEIRSVADNRLLATLPASTNLICYNLTWSNDGRFVTVKRDHPGWGVGADLEVWDLDREPRRILLIRGAGRNVRSYHPIHPHLVTSDSEGSIITWDLERGAELTRHHAFDEPAEFLAHSPDGSRLAALVQREHDSIVSIHDTTNATRLASHFIAFPVKTIAWHPHGRHLAVTDRRGNVHLLDAESGRLQTLGRHRAEAVTAAFDRSGGYLITGGWERSLNCWDLRTMQRAFVIELDSYLAQMRSDGRQWALFTPNGIQIHSLEQPVQRQFAEDLGSRLRFAAFSPDGRWLAAAADERLGVWDLQNQGPGALSDAGAEASPYWNSDGTQLFGSRRADGAARWHVRPADRSGEAPILEPLDLPLPRGFTGLSLDSDQLAWTTTRGSQITGLDPATPNEQGWVPTAPGMNGLSADGRWLGIYQAYTQTLHVYRRPRLELAAKLTCMENIAGFQFSPSGDEVAVSSRGQIEFWNTQNWERTRVLTQFSGLPHVGVLVQPDTGGWWLARELRFACLHEVGSLEPRLPLPSSMSPIAVSTDGRHLAVSVEARHLQVWDLALVRRHLRALGVDWDDSRR